MTRSATKGANLQQLGDARQIAAELKLLAMRCELAAIGAWPGRQLIIV
jgi:hypothetical protein